MREPPALSSQEFGRIRRCPRWRADKPRAKQEMRFYHFAGLGLLISIALSCVCAPETFASLVEPDRLFAKTGNWRISTARFGIGCIAVYPYGSNGELSIGGERWNDLSLILTADRRKFSGNLDEESDVSSIEFVLGDQRWDGLKPYGYRGTPGVVLSLNKQHIAKLKIAPSLKLTERGSLKLSIPLRNTGAALKKLSECFKRTH